MLVYRSDDELVDSHEALDRLVARIAALGRPSHDDVVSVFIDLGELESAIADAVFPQADGVHPLATALRSAALTSAHALLASWRHETERRDRSFAALLKSLRTLARDQLPRQVSVRVAEGYAFYELRPETYAAAATQWLAQERPASTVCIGIRSIGCSLSAVVAAAIERRGLSVVTHSVRPRGHPFDRHLVLDASLSNSLRRASTTSHFLVVDEGPGLSGSSFASVARALRELGIANDRIIFFPSSNPDGTSFVSDTARTIWNDHRRYPADAGEGSRSIRIRADAGGIDISAGKWRDTLWRLRRDAPAVHPQHEAVRQWIPPTSTIVRFAGLGHYGEAKLRRAQILADAGLGPSPLGLDDGYLSLRFIPASSWATPSNALIGAIARHCSFLTSSFPRRRSPSVDTVFDMIATNLEEAQIAVPALEPYRTVLDEAPCAAIDGRMFPHEWLPHDRGFIKVDALDHHQDHFFPGIQDVGWDLAAAAFEFDLDASGRTRLLEHYMSHSRDHDVARRLPFYEIAYPAFRLGYARMAAQSLGNTTDGRRFHAVAERCRLHLVKMTALSPTVPNAP